MGVCDQAGVDSAGEGLPATGVRGCREPVPDLCGEAELLVSEAGGVVVPGPDERRDAGADDVRLDPDPLRHGVNGGFPRLNGVRGDVLIPNNAPTLDYRAGHHTLVDLEARYTLPMGVNIAVGANNVFDEYPNKTPTIVNTNGPIGFPSYSPFGFNGRFLYTRLTYNW